MPVSARLAPVSVRWDENDLLDNRGDMVNGVNTETMQTVAQKLATDIVDKMQEVSELKKELWFARGQRRRAYLAYRGCNEAVRTRRQRARRQTETSPRKRRRKSRQRMKRPRRRRRSTSRWWSRLDKTGLKPTIMKWSRWPS